MSLVCRALPAMPQSPLATSSMVTHVTGRIASPSTLTMASVSFSMIVAFSAASKTPAMSFTWIRGMVPPGWCWLLRGCRSTGDVTRRGSSSPAG